jgi:predicted secreted protein
MKKALRSSSVKSPRKARTPAHRLLVKKAAAPEMTPDEVVHLETISQRYEESERAWLRMTAAPEGDETWTHVEEHLLTQTSADQDRRWKFFSK